MKKYKSLLLCLSFLLICSGIYSSPKNIANHNNPVPVIQLSGNGYQRGLQHGKMLKNEIAQVYEKWKENLQNATKENADSLLSEFYHATNFEPAIKKWTPELFNEIKGIADGSGQSFQDVYCFQLLDELWVYIDRKKQADFHHCSGMGVAASDSHPGYIAQNMDLESYMNGYQVLLHLAANKNEPEQLVLSCAGLIGLNGINSKSIAVCVNTLMQLNASSNGLPVAFVIRGLLSKSSRPATLNFIKAVKHASGQNYILGIVDSVYDFEASTNKVARYIPSPKNPGIVYHTNHPISNNDIKPWYAASVKKLNAGEEKNNNSYARFVDLKQRIDRTGKDVSDNLFKQTLSSKDSQLNPICRTYKEGTSVFTFSSVIMTLGKNPSIQLTKASPDQSDYVMHSFSGK